MFFQMEIYQMVWQPGFEEYKTDKGIYTFPYAAQTSPSILFDVSFFKTDKINKKTCSGWAVPSSV